MVNTPVKEYENQPIRVLLVEDNRVYGQLVTMALNNDEELVFDLTWADSLAAAFDCLAQKNFDVVLLDLLLPDSEGLDTFTSINSNYPSLPIILLTASDDRKVAVEAIKRGAQDYLVKQRISEESLVRCIRYGIARKNIEESSLRLQAIEDFISTLAHDLQVPMLGADRALDILLSAKTGHLTETQQNLISELKESNVKLLKMVQRLIEIYRYESLKEGSRDQVNIRLLAQNLIAEYEQPIKDRQLNMQLNGQDAAANVPGDAKGLHLLFANLIDNAIKFSDHGSTIEIAINDADKALEIAIRNSGQGIRPEDQKHLFTRLWQGVPGKKYVAGTGLGLYMCKRIVDRHQGSIRCDSTASGVTTFTVMLPI